MRLIKNVGADRVLDQFRSQLPASAKVDVTMDGLFTPGGTHAKKGEFAGIADFKVVAFPVIA